MRLSLISSEEEETPRQQHAQTDLHDRQQQRPVHTTCIVNYSSTALASSAPEGVYPYLPPFL